MNDFSSTAGIKLHCSGDFEVLAAAVRTKLSGSDSSHDLDHTLRVMHNVELLLAHTPGADADVVRLSALLHDIARPEEDSARGCCCHAELGAQQSAVLLKKYNFPDEIISQVVHAVRCHRFRKGSPPETVEGQLLYDADKLDSLGAVGLGRAFLFAGHCNARLHNSASEALAGNAYSKEDTAYREYLVKLRHLPDKMFTPYGKKLAVERLKFMENFFSALESEINGRTQTYQNLL